MKYNKETDGWARQTMEMVPSFFFLNDDASDEWYISSYQFKWIVCLFSRPSSQDTRRSNGPDREAPRYKEIDDVYNLLLYI
jgi:hypothetical protein